MAKNVVAAAAEKRSNPHSGSSFDDFLRDEGIFEETQAKASERARNEQIEDSLQADKRLRLAVTAHPPNGWATSCPPYPADQSFQQYGTEPDETIQHRRSEGNQ